MLALIFSHSAVLAPPPEAMTRSSLRPAAASMMREMAGGREGDALQDGAVEMRQAVAGADAEELRARVAMRAEPLAGEVGHEEQAVGAGGRLGGARDDLVVAERLLVEGAPRPAHRVAAGLEQDERSPMSLDRRDVADFGIEQRRVGDQREDAGGAGHVGGEAGPAGAGAEQRHRIVGAADQHRRAFARGRSRAPPRP